MPGESRWSGRRRSAALRLVLILVFLGVAGWVLVRAADQVVGSSSSTRRASTVASMRTVVKMLKGYRADKGAYPANLAALVSGGFLEAAATDGWGRAFAYSAPGPDGREFAFFSLGPDGAQGTDDDVDWWRVDQE